MHTRKYSVLSLLHHILFVPIAHAVKYHWEIIEWKLILILFRIRFLGYRKLEAVWGTAMCMKGFSK